MRSFRFEETPLLWHFAREMIGGQWYNHAWTDTFLDMLIPDGKLMYVAAPEWYTKERKAKATSYSATTNPVTIQGKSDGFLTESLWSVTHAAHAARFSRESEAKLAAAAAYDYYTKTRDFVADFVVPGGIENCRKYSKNEISTATFLQKITEDVRNDAIAAMLGSLIGAGTGGASAALATGGTMAIPGAIIGAKEGAAIGIAISRTVKAGVRSGGGSGAGSSGQRRMERVERKFTTPQEQNEFVKKHLKKENFKIGGRDAYLDTKTGKYYTKDTRHYDLEAWRVTGKKAEHLGSAKCEPGLPIYKLPSHKPQQVQ